MTDEMIKLREEFIEQIGLIAQCEGLPKIAGRLMGFLIFGGKAYSFGEIAAELQVSRGSISTNARMLETIGVIEKAAVPGNRQDYYRLADNPYERLLRGVVERSRKAQGVIGKTLTAIPDCETETKARIKSYEHFYRTMASKLEAAASLLAEKKET